MNTPKTANWIFQKTFRQPNPHPESTPTRSKKAPKKTFHKHVVSIILLTHTRSKKPSKFGIFFSLNILMKHDQQNCGKKKESNIYGGIFFCNYMFAWKRKNKGNQVQWIPVNIVCQSWNYLQKIKVDVFVERHLKITKNLFILGERKFCEIIWKPPLCLLAPAQPGVHWPN